MSQVSAPNLRKKVKVKRRGSRIKTPSLSPPKRTCLTKLMRDASLSKPAENESGHASRHGRAHSWTTVTPPSSPACEKDKDDFKTPSTISSSPEPPPGTPPETPKKISFKLKSSMIKLSKTKLTQAYSSDTLSDSSSSESSSSSRGTPRVYRSRRASRSTSTSSSTSSAPRKSKKKRSKAAERKEKNESRSRSRSPKNKPSSSSKRKKTTRRTSRSPTPTPKKKAHDLKRKRSHSSSRSCSSERKTKVHRSRRGEEDRTINKGKDKSPSRDHSRSHSGHKKKQKKREQSRSPSHDRSPRHSRRSRSRSPLYARRSVITQNGRQLREPSNEIVVFNCPKSCTAKELHEIFKEFGLIREVNVARDRFTGQSRGFAFITFDQLESAKRAIEKIVDSMEIGERRLQCNYSWGQNRLPDAVQRQYGNRKKL